MIENRAGLDLGATERFAAIVGEAPSRGARSPSLWNAAFRSLGISATMHPLDVRPENLAVAIATLRDDARFIGGAVAVPYKQTVASLLDEIEPEARAIGAVNCLYRRGHALVGANTDGAGFLSVLAAELGEGFLRGRSGVVLGAGGAGRAVATYVGAAIGRDGRLVLANRTIDRAESLAGQLRGTTKVEVSGLPVEPGVLAEADVVVNCTSIGFEAVRSDGAGAYTLRPYTPLAEVDAELRVPAGERAGRRYMIAARGAVLRNAHGTFEALARACERAVVCDIVYQPLQTALLNAAACFGLRTIDGLRMNFEQAVIAFRKAAEGSALGPCEAERVRAAMRSA
ncbi:MAG TPA: hypothetical protein VHF87_13470 [Methylomirabilota bacterium]|nr:hypothetical protein [Methylomirabilota bacterium]